MMLPDLQSYPKVRENFHEKISHHQYFFLKLPRKCIRFAFRFMQFSAKTP